MQCARISSRVVKSVRMLCLDPVRLCSECQIARHQWDMETLFTSVVWSYRLVLELTNSVVFTTLAPCVRPTGNLAVSFWQLKYRLMVLWLVHRRLMKLLSCKREKQTNKQTNRDNAFGTVKVRFKATVISLLTWQETTIINSELQSDKESLDLVWLGWGVGYEGGVGQASR